MKKLNLKKYETHKYKLKDIQKALICHQIMMTMS